MQSCDLCWGFPDSAQIFCFTFINIYTARSSDWTQTLLLADGSLYRKYERSESAHLCINVNKNIEQRLWSRFQTL